jgi:hypothetical protein
MMTRLGRHISPKMDGRPTGATPSRKTRLGLCLTGLPPSHGPSLSSRGFRDDAGAVMSRKVQRVCAVYDECVNSIDALFGVCVHG